MQVPKFRDFINEAKKPKDKEPITVVVITKSSPKVRQQKTGNRKTKKEITVSFIERSCKKRKIPCFIAKLPKKPTNFAVSQRKKYSQKLF